MPHQVGVLKNNTTLPDGKVYQSGQRAVLSDDQFAKLASDVFTSNTLTDLGYAPINGSILSDAKSQLVTPGINDVTVTGVYKSTVHPNAPTTDVSGALVSGTLLLANVRLNRGDTASRVTFYTGTTAAGTPTNWWVALYSWAAAPALLASSANQTTGAIAANSVIDLAFTAPYTVPTDSTGATQFYVGLMVAATTVPSLICQVRTVAATNNETHPTAATSTTGLTTTPPNPAAAPVAVANQFKAYVH